MAGSFILAQFKKKININKYACFSFNVIFFEIGLCQFEILKSE